MIHSRGVLERSLLIYLLKKNTMEIVVAFLVPIALIGIIVVSYLTYKER